MAYWRGVIDTRLKDIESSVNHINTDIEAIKEDIAESNVKIAGYVKVFAVLVAIFTLIAPFLIRLFFGLKV
mgnify:FL=1